MIPIESSLLACDDDLDTPFLVRRNEDRNLELQSVRISVLVVDDHKLIADSL